ncbi:hypothetical protein [Moraxella sp. ZY200743]|uniref:hypothetical protein n=1 Tax=Moraxella sp. ZY200743 TaxID=2911970 RepID=UPI003D7E10D2
MPITHTSQNTLDNLTKSQINGSFFLNTHLSHNIKNILQSYSGFGNLDPVQAESLHSMINIISYIVNGDNHFIGHWQELQSIISEVIQEMKTHPNNYEAKTVYEKVDYDPF